MPNAWKPLFAWSNRKAVRPFYTAGKACGLTELSDRVVLDINKLTEFPAVELLLYELLKDYGINPLTVNQYLIPSAAFREAVSIHEHIASQGQDGF